MKKIILISVIELFLASSNVWAGGPNWNWEECYTSQYFNLYFDPGTIEYGWDGHAKIMVKYLYPKDVLYKDMYDPRTSKKEDIWFRWRISLIEIDCPHMSFEIYNATYHDQEGFITGREDFQIPNRKSFYFYNQGPYKEIWNLREILFTYGCMNQKR